MARYIDADKLKERLKIISVVADDLYGMGINRGLDRADTEIDMLPEADVVEVRHGHWMKEGCCFYCSECKKTYGFGSTQTIYDVKRHWLHCPNCGAKMDGGKTE